MSTLEVLNDKNEMKIYSVFSEEFKAYGRVVEGYDFSEALDFMKEETAIPEDGNAYVPSLDGLEKLSIKDEIQSAFYGGMPIQIGYCNGKNSTFNGFEYHKGSEINVTTCDICLSLGHSYDISDKRYSNEQAQVFFVPANTAIEMYQTTLHLAPLKVSDEGYRVIVILPKGTNTPLTEEEKNIKETAKDSESDLLLQRNKWVIAHPDRKPLIDQGAYPGIIGENTELFY